MKPASPLMRWLAVALAITLPVTSAPASGAACREASAAAKPDQGGCCCTDGCKCGPTCNASNQTPAPEREFPKQGTDRRELAQSLLPLTAQATAAADAHCFLAGDSAAADCVPHLQTLVSKHICLQV